MYEYNLGIRFDAIAESHANQLALWFNDDVVVSYKRLNCLANQMARFLIEKGVGGAISRAKVKTEQRVRRSSPPVVRLEANEAVWVKQAERGLIFYNDDPAAQRRLLRAMAEIHLLQAACFPPQTKKYEQRALNWLEARIKLGENDAALLRSAGILAFRRSLYIQRLDPPEAGAPAHLPTIPARHVQTSL